MTFFASDGTSQSSVSTTLLITPAAARRRSSPPWIVRSSMANQLHPLAGDRSGRRGAHLFQRLPAGRGHARSGHGRFPMDAELHRTGAYAIPFTVSNGVAATTRTTPIAVLAVIAAPVFEGLGPWQVAEGRVVQFRSCIRSGQPRLLAARSPARRQLDPA